MTDWGFYCQLPVILLVVSLVYGGTRHDRWGAIVHEAVRWTVRMGLFLLGIVLILAGLAMDDASWLWRGGLTGAGLVLEFVLLFVK
ncbi:MAG: hypothetical protein NZ700_13030 [Gemmataceae bacterium]|nr:hypothetical protein [Gemmataceae bacterium]MDW8266254.1 hypothetical protein [Gemmataceae bacterium]